MSRSYFDNSWEPRFPALGVGWSTPTEQKRKKKKKNTCDITQYPGEFIDNNERPSCDVIK